MSESHPIWGIIRLSIIMSSLTAVLYLNASEFDATELKTIITMFVVAGGAEWAPQLIRGLTGKKDD